MNHLNTKKSVNIKLNAPLPGESFTTINKQVKRQASSSDDSRPKPPNKILKALNEKTSDNKVMCYM